MQPLTTSHVTRFACLDGIRGVAILLVMLSHLQDPIGGPFVGLGQFGVWLFFSLSSFLLSFYFFDKPERLFRGREWLNYAARRFLRIYPLFTLATIAAVFAGWWGWEALKPVLLLQYPGWWAIFVEFRFYFLLPVVVFAFDGAARVHRHLPWLLLACAFAAHYCLVSPDWVTPGYEPDKRGGVAAISYEYLIVFVTGCFAAWFYVTYRSMLAAWRRSRLLDALLAIAIIAPFLLGGETLSYLLRANVDPTWYHFDWVPFGIYFAIVLVGVMTSDGLTRLILSRGPLRILGLISYSLYMEMDFLFHPAWQFVQKRGLPPYCIYLALIPSVALACISYLLIERPFSRIALIGSTSRNLSSQPAPSVP